MGHMDFDQAYDVYIATHQAARTGERLGRLLRGQQHAEKLLLRNVWWPVFKSFDFLHPEYEVFDWNRKSLFLDYAFLGGTGTMIVSVWSATASKAMSKIWIGKSSATH